MTMKTIKRIFFPKEFTNEIFYHIAKEFNNADGKFDEIHFILNSYGGPTDLGILAANAIKSARSKIVTFSDSICDSAAGFIFIHGHERVITKRTTMVIHPQEVFPRMIPWGQFLRLKEKERDIFYHYTMKECKVFYDEYLKAYCERTLLPKRDLKYLLSEKGFEFTVKDLIKYKIADKVVDSFSHFKENYNPQLEESFAD